MRKELFKKHLGKIVIIAVYIILGIYSNCKFYDDALTEDKYYSGTVLNKDVSMTTGKYPRQYWVVSFKYDDPILGTQDVETSYSTYAKLNPGDRTSFKVFNRVYKQKSSSHPTLYVLLFTINSMFAVVFDFILIVIICGCFISLLIYVWKSNY